MKMSYNLLYIIIIIIIMAQQIFRKKELQQWRYFNTYIPDSTW
jgi:hypothetical protein